MGLDPAILVTGGSGQVGTAIDRMWPHARVLPRSSLDVTDPVAVQHHVRDVQVVVHLAAFTDVDGCENDPRRAEAANVQGTANVVEAARRVGARVIYLSTDYVFDGAQRTEYTEEDQPRPINVYGRTKYEGERLLDVACDLVIRTSWVYGGPQDFFSKIRQIADRSDASIEVVDDQWGKPTFADDVAAAVVFLIESDRSGVVHVSGDGPPTTWRDLAEVAVGDRVRVIGSESSRYRASRDHRVAPRPTFSALSIARARDWGVPLRPWRESLDRYLGRTA